MRSRCDVGLPGTLCGFASFPDTEEAENDPDRRVRVVFHCKIGSPVTTVSVTGMQPPRDCSPSPLRLEWVSMASTTTFCHDGPVPLYDSVVSSRTSSAYEGGETSVDLGVGTLGFTGQKREDGRRHTQSLCRTWKTESEELGLGGPDVRREPLETRRFFLILLTLPPHFRRTLWFLKTIRETGSPVVLGSLSPVVYSRPTIIKDLAFYQQATMH